MFIILKSILLVCIVSGTITSLAHILYNVEPIGIFVLTTLIQFALSWYLKTYIAHKRNIALTQQQTALLEQIETEATEAPCAYCNTINMIPIQPDINNDFECTECGETNAVYVNITIAQKSVPIDKPEYDVTNYNSGLATAKNKILTSTENE